MKHSDKFIQTWTQQPLGVLIRNWWKARLRASSAKVIYPWSDEVQEAVNGPGALRVCHRCPTPQEHLGWFCPKCGTATGPYNNCMPFVYVFSTGEVLRAGVNPEFKFHRGVIPTYFFIGLFEFGIFAPFYWIRLWRAQIKRTENVLTIDDDSQI